jgi:cyclase
MREVGAGGFAYIQATGETGISNAGLIVGADGAVAVDALMVPSMTRRLVAAIKQTTSRKIGSLLNTHHHLDHTGGNQFFRGATIVASAKCRDALVPGFPPVPILNRFIPAFARGSRS